MAKLEFKDGREVHVDEDKLIAEIEEGEAAYGRDILEYDPFVNPGNEITRGDVEAAFRIARKPRSKAELTAVHTAIKKNKRFYDAFRLIELGTDLFTTSESDVHDVITGPLQDLIQGLVDVKNVDVAVATKILHLKRPALVPILDRYIFAFYSYLYVAGKGQRNVGTALRLLREFRADGRNNLNVLNVLGGRMTEAANKKLPPGQKVSLTPVRVLDRVIWRHIKKRTG
jgi:hypothetical protein